MRCDHNIVLARGAEACFARLEALEARYGAEAMRIAGGGVESQHGKTQTGGKEYAFSADVLARLIYTADLAYDDLEEYHGYYLPPPDSGTPASAEEILMTSQSECEEGNRRRVEAVQELLLQKIARFEARREESVAHQGTLKGRATNFGSLNERAPASAKAKASSGPKAVKKTRKSTLTGVEQDAAKRAGYPGKR